MVAYDQSRVLTLQVTLGVEIVHDVFAVERVVVYWVICTTQRAKQHARGVLFYLFEVKLRGAALGCLHHMFLGSATQRQLHLQASHPDILLLPEARTEVLQLRRLFSRSWRQGLSSIRTQNSVHLFVRASLRSCFYPVDLGIHRMAFQSMLNARKFVKI